MQSALYFPFTEPKSAAFLKNALFLWDTVDFIVPWEDFRPQGDSHESSEAFDIVARTYVPTPEDKKRIHIELMDICTSKVPEDLLFDLEKPDIYNFWPQKLLPETWDMLQDTNLARIVKDGNDVRVASTRALFGYYMMSAVAVCCANGRKRLVTDESDPYRTLANTLVDTPRQDDASPENWHGRLIALTLGAPDLSDVSLKDLVNLRKREDALLYDLRHIFVDALDGAVQEISANASNRNVVRDIIENFTSTMERDMVELKRLLRRSTTSILFSPIGGATVLASAAGMIAPIANLVTIGGLSKSLFDYQDRRHKILREHPSAWLFAGAREFKIH